MGPSKTPTKLEREWMARISDLGCYACRCDGIQSPASVHHIVQGYRRLGHLFTIPLCYEHHQGKSGVHMAKRSFTQRYGLELDILAELQKER